VIRMTTGTRRTLLAVLWGLLAVITWLLINRGIDSMVHGRPEVIVPNVEGRSIADALDLVSAAGLALKKRAATNNPQLPVGTVVSQSPPPGMTVRAGRFVNVTVSLGGEKVFVPSVIGMEQREAEVHIRQYGLAVGSVTARYSLRYTRGRVLSQTPVENAIVDRGARVELVVSSGVPPEGVILVPDFVGRPAAEAVAWAGDQGGQVLTREVLVERGFSAGYVLEQRPLPDALFERGQRMELVVARISSDTAPVDGAAVTPSRQEPNFTYTLPEMGSTMKQVRIVFIGPDPGSPDNELIVYQQPTKPGTTIARYVPPRPGGRIRIFVDGVLIDEKIP